MQMHAQFLAPVEPQQRIVVVEVISRDIRPQTAMAQQAQHPEIDNGAAEIRCVECQARSDLRPSAFSHFFSLALNFDEFRLSSHASTIDALNSLGSVENFLIAVCVQDLFNATEVDAASLTISVNKQLFASVNHIE